MPTIHELLDETQKKADSLAQEIESLRSARVVSEELNIALKLTCNALEKTSNAIRPFTDQRIHRMQMFIIGFFVLNSIMFGVTLYLLLRK